MIVSSPSMAQKLELFPGVPEDIAGMIRDGSYEKAKEALLGKAETVEEPLSTTLRFQAECLDRIRLDFRQAEEEVLSEVAKTKPDVTTEDLARWREEGSLWYRVIDGENLYFNRAVRNLYRLDPSLKKKVPTGNLDGTSYVSHLRDVMEAGKDSSSPYVLPIRLQIEYTIKVKPGFVPEGEIIRCWAPYPRECDTQCDVKLIHTDPEVQRIAPANQTQRSLYFEQPAAGDGQPTVFRMVYEYTVSGYYEEIDPNKIEPYDTESELYRTFTESRDPHLIMTPEILATAKEIVQDETNSYIKAKKIFDWMQQNITYTSMLEYSTVPNHSAWCLKYKQGDCGTQALLFVALCRAAGVPARWQSGWTVEPGNVGMHDWAEFYVEPYGWLRSDPSRGYVATDDPVLREFQFGNFDHFRMIVNGDYGRQFDPPKNHFRSEPIDFQRGELEWRGGNLYFNTWSYRMTSEEVK